MALTIPKLDDRQFQDLVSEARNRIPQYCKEWTDYNLSDPGMTLIELFAWMTDVLLYRLNQVPDLHYIKFLQMLGVNLQETQPAGVRVTFWLTAPQPTAVLIPINTEVASTQTETEPSIVFSTEVDLRIQPPQLVTMLTRTASDQEGKKSMRELNLRRMAAGIEGIDIFTARPQLDDALYFGFENDLSDHLLGFDLNYDPAGGAGIRPELPPYVWEASSGEKDVRWNACEVESDSTKGMNSQGRIRVHLPKMGKYELNKQALYWVRVRVKEITPAEQREGMQPYDKSPRLRQVSCASWGGTVGATHARRIGGEVLGVSDGSPGQRFRLQMTPILKRAPGEHLILHIDQEQSQIWTEVPDFAESGSNDRHYTLDSQTGELRLGPAIRQTDGTIKLYGAVPPRNARLIFERYRYGGGHAGNVQAQVLNTLKTAIPFVSRVANRTPALGGLDAETLEAAMVRAPSLLRSRERAVTESDYEFLARQALPARIGRVKCLQPRPEEAGRIVPGKVFVLVIPHNLHPERFLSPEQLELAEQDIAALTAFLDERRLLTTQLDIRAPAYHWVSVQVKLRAASADHEAQVQRDVLSQLYRFLNPLVGGLDKNGWPFGRNLFVSDVYQCLQGIPNVLFTRQVELFAARPGGEAQGDPQEVIDVVAHGVIASGVHSLEFV